MLFLLKCIIIYLFIFQSQEFINGAEVKNSDACLAENGVVHVIGSVIPSSSSSIANVLESNPQFSNFKDLLDALNITKYLQDTCVSRTVFAPTNNAFPGGALECLKRPENRRIARKLALTHIAYPTDYTSSLSERSFIRTFSRRYLLVCVINGTVHLTRDSIPLDQVNIPARNGVIHSINQVLLGSRINFNELCPVPPSPGSSPTPSQPMPPSDFTDPGVISDPSSAPSPVGPGDDMIA